MIQLLKVTKYIPLFLLVLLSCKLNKTPDLIEEGIITYDITYFQTEKENPLISLLPTQMTITFKGDKAVSVFEGWMGIFSSCLITDISEGENKTLIKLSDKKYYSVSAIDEPFIGEKIDSIYIKNLEETKDIAGYKCKKSTVKIYNPENSSFDIYYTDELNLKYPNINSPFKDIQGVLMEFQMEINSIEMKLTFNNLNTDKIHDSVFNVPEGYHNISRTEMEEILESVSFN